MTTPVHKLVDDAEELAPGVVLVHAETELAEGPSVVFGVSREGVRWSSDEDTAHVFVLLLDPPGRDATRHLQNLASVARMFHSADVIERVRDDGLWREYQDALGAARAWRKESREALSPKVDTARAGGFPIGTLTSRGVVPPNVVRREMFAAMIATVTKGTDTGARMRGRWITSSQHGFCHGNCGAVRTSSIPIARCASSEPRRPHNR